MLLHSWLNRKPGRHPEDWPGMKPTAWRDGADTAASTNTEEPPSDPAPQLQFPTRSCRRCGMTSDRSGCGCGTGLLVLALAAVVAYATNIQFLTAAVLTAAVVACARRLTKGTRP